MNTARYGLVAACALLAVPVARAQWFSLVGTAPGGTGSRAMGLSADGGVASGFTSQLAGSVGFTWIREGGRNDFGLEPGIPAYSPSLGISGDGGTVVGGGLTQAFGRYQAYRWNGPGTFQTLPLLPGGEGSHALDADMTGSVVVGYSFIGLQEGIRQACRWTEAGVQGLGYARPEPSASEARAVSLDGLTIVGENATPSLVEAFVWRADTGMLPLPALPGTGASGSSAEGVNFDGSVIVGRSGLGSKATVWTHGIPAQLPELPGRPLSAANSTNASGSVVGGWIAADFLNLEAAVWTDGAVVRLTDLLALHGVSVPPGVSLSRITAVDSTGTIFAGFTGSPGTFEQGFVAMIPSPCTSLIFGMLLVTPLCRRRERTKEPSCDTSCKSSPSSPA